METKICSKCQVEKEIDWFSWRNKAKGTKNVWCKKCSTEYRMGKYFSEHEIERSKRNLYRTITYDRNRALVVEYLRNNPCVDCGEARLVVLEFDHVMGIKTDNISYMIARSSTRALLAEIKKCEVRCANCHRIKTAKERGWYYE